MCPTKCQTLKFLEPSYLEGRIVGQCLACGATFHGYRSNWRLVHDAERGFFVMRRRKLKDEKKKARPKRSVAPRRDMDLVKELSGEGMTLAKASAILKQYGYVVK